MPCERSREASAGALGFFSRAGPEQAVGGPLARIAPPAEAAEAEARAEAWAAAEAEAREGCDPASLELMEKVVPEPCIPRAVSGGVGGGASGGGGDPGAELVQTLSMREQVSTLRQLAASAVAAASEPAPRVGLSGRRVRNRTRPATCKTVMPRDVVYPATAASAHGMMNGGMMESAEHKSAFEEEAPPSMVSEVYEACVDIFSARERDASFRLEARNDVVTCHRKTLPGGGSCLVTTVCPVMRSVAETMQRFEVNPDDFSWANEHLKIWQSAAPDYDIQSFKVLSDISPNDQLFHVVVRARTPKHHALRFLDLVWLNTRHPPSQNKDGLGFITSVPIETPLCPEKPELERIVVPAGAYVVFPLPDNPKSCGISRVVYSKTDRDDAGPGLLLPRSARCLSTALAPLRCLDLCGGAKTRHREDCIKDMLNLKRTIETAMPATTYTEPPAASSPASHSA